MRIRTITCLGLLIGFVCPKAASAAEIDVTAWTLQSTINLGGGGGIADGTTTVTNGLDADYFATLQNSTSFSSITASWDAAGFFEFVIDAEHAAQGTPGGIGFSRSTASIFVIPVVNSVLTIDATYTYDLGNGDRTAELRVNAAQDGVGSIYFSNQIALPIIGDPRQGTFTAHETVPLDAGVAYGFGYGLTLESFGGSPTSLSLANGSVHFSIAPVCEPTTALLLFAVAPVLLRRSKRRRLTA